MDVCYFQEENEESLNVWREFSFFLNECSIGEKKIDEVLETREKLGPKVSILR